MSDMSDDELAQALCEIDHGLTPWEVDFVESIAKRVLDEGRSLTGGQREKAEDIYEKAR